MNDDPVARLYTCGAGKIRNPRTDRCVLQTRPLGRALHAAAAALRAGQAMPACTTQGAAYDPAERKCTTDPSRVAALRELLRRAQAANRDAGALARMVASHALAKASAANNIEQRNRLLAEARDMVQYAMNTQAAGDGAALELQRRLAQTEAQLAACRDQLRDARRQAANVQRVLLQNNR